MLKQYTHVHRKQLQFFSCKGLFDYCYCDSQKLLTDSYSKTEWLAAIIIVVQTTDILSSRWLPVCFVCLCVLYIYNWIWCCYPLRKELELSNMLLTSYTKLHILCRILGATVKFFTLVEAKWNQTGHNRHRKPQMLRFSDNNLLTDHHRLMAKSPLNVEDSAHFGEWSGWDYEPYAFGYSTTLRDRDVDTGNSSRQFEKNRQ